MVTNGIQYPYLIVCPDRYLTPMRHEHLTFLLPHGHGRLFKQRNHRVEPLLSLQKMPSV